MTIHDHTPHIEGPHGADAEFTPGTIVVGSRPDCQFLNGWSDPGANDGYPFTLQKLGNGAVAAYGYIHRASYPAGLSDVCTIPEDWQDTKYGIAFPAVGGNDVSERHVLYSLNDKLVWQSGGTGTGAVDVQIGTYWIVTE